MMRLAILAILFLFSELFISLGMNVAYGEEQSDVLTRILALDETGIYAGSPTIGGLAKDPKFIEEIGRRWSEVKDSDGRIKVLLVLREVGTVLSAAQTSHREFFLLTNSDVIGILVGALDDPSSKVRAEASRFLTEYCPDEALFSRGPAIVSAIKKHANTDGIRLLGKTMCKEAGELLVQDNQFANSSGKATDLALAKLGDLKKEKAWITSFLSEKDPDKKAALARDLGYIATPGAIAALASEMRTAQVVKHGNGAIALRVILVESLQYALPNNSMFWGVRNKQWTDDRYKQIEKWAEEVMHVQWKSVRPPFFHSMPDTGPPPRGGG